MITLGQVAQEEFLRMECLGCERRARLPIAKLLADHGSEAVMAAVLESVTASCPARKRHGGDVCAPWCPELVGLVCETADAEIC
jgi:hypothetical protein